MGTRLGETRPKAFVELDGRTLLRRSVDAALASGVIDRVVVMVPPELVAQTRADLPEVLVVAGGAERSDSVRAGLAAVDADLVLVHDAARALTPPELFARVVGALRAGAAAVVPGLPVADTLKRVGLQTAGTETAGPETAGPETVLGTVDRAELRAIQTPQGFDAATLRRAHAGGGDATDDAGLVEALGVDVQVVPGEALAFKITTPFDLRIARLLCGAPASAAAADGDGQE